jgi:hypothetical protein
MAFGGSRDYNNKYDVLDGLGDSDLHVLSLRRDRQWMTGRLSRSPLHGNQRFEIDHPEATVLRQGVAIFIAPGFVSIHFDHDSVVQIIDSPASSAPGKEDTSRAE